MKGVIWKYYAKASDPDPRDEMGRLGCVVANPDPDFWENSFLLWAICGPRVRANLRTGNVLFFSWVLQKAREAGVPNYLYRIDDCGRDALRCKALSGAS
jgi:hypothetical protein